MKLINYISQIRDVRPEWTERYIISQIEEKRAVMLKNRLNQMVKINDVITQTLEVKLDVADQSEFIDYLSSSRILKSNVEIPSLIAEHNRHAFMSVRIPELLGVNFTVMDSASDARYAGNGRANKRAVFCFIYNNYLYIKISNDNPKIALIDTVSVNGVFESPMDVFKYQNPDYEGRDFWDLDYPINSADWVYIKGIILNGTAQTEQI